MPTTAPVATVDTDTNGNNTPKPNNKRTCLAIVGCIALAGILIGVLSGGDDSDPVRDYDSIRDQNYSSNSGGRTTSSESLTPSLVAVALVDS